MEELYNRPRAFRVLVKLAQEEPINMRQFAEVSFYARPHAQKLREDLERLGYIIVSEGRGHGAFGVLEIRLTPFGRRVAEHLVAAHNAVQEERRRHPSKDTSLQ